MPEQKEKTVKVKLTRPHKHRGEQYQVDDVLDLPEKQAAFVVRAKSGVKV